MNRITITGRLTSEPELRNLSSGSSVCQLRVAVDGMGRGGREEPGYINVSAFGAAGEAAARYLTKGSPVAIDGRLEYHSWEGEDGAKRHDYQVVGAVEFLPDGRGRAESEDAEVPVGAPAA